MTRFTVLTFLLSFQKITSKVELVVENSDGVDVTFKTKCKGYV